MLQRYCYFELSTREKDGKACSMYSLMIFNCLVLAFPPIFHAVAWKSKRIKLCFVEPPFYISCIYVIFAFVFFLWKNSMIVMLLRIN